MQSVGELVDKFSEVLLVGRVDLLPIDYYAGSFRAAQHRKNTLNEPILPAWWSVCEILNGFRLPRVPHEVGQQRHEGDSFGRGQFQEPGVPIDLQVAHAIGHGHPFRANMGNLRCVLLK